MILKMIQPLSTKKNQRIILLMHITGLNLTVEEIYLSSSIDELPPIQPSHQLSNLSHPTPQRK